MILLKYYIFWVLLLLTGIPAAYSQSYGLGFSGNGVVQDKRTGLDLSLKEPICLDKNFKLSFDLAFIPGHTDYFGYIFRLIDKEERNIDLVYDMRFEEDQHFKLIVGNKISDIAFDIDINDLYKVWHKINLEFNVEKKMLMLSVDGHSYKSAVQLKGNCYQLLLGSNNYKSFKIKDVPPMKIREVKITENNELSYYWPLDEKTGNKAAEKIKGKNGGVSNPIWIKKLHHDWELVKELVIAGAASVAMNPKKEELYVVGEDSLGIYNLLFNQLAYQRYASGTQRLMPGNQSLYNTGGDRLFNMYMDQELVTDFDFSAGKWSRKYISPDVITVFWHPNKFYSKADSSIYMIGGYGQYKYRKTVFRHHLPDNHWTEIQTSGNFTPRYLSALGATDRGAYILGGYGSATGEQILNPKNVYDLNFYDVKSRTFRKIFELKPASEDFAFANSMVINEKANTYYALKFPNDHYKSSLQLIQGSLSSPSYKLVGSSIPYTFHDINSFADLYYCPINQKYVAVTLLRDEKKNQTSVKIYTLYGPPEGASLSTGTNSQLLWTEIAKYTIILILLLAAGGLYIYMRYKKRNASMANDIVKVPVPVLTNLAEDRTDISVSDSKTAVPQEPKKGERNTIFLFGDMQLFDKSGVDITKLLSPLIRELFLVVLLYTIKWGRGISSEKLTEILWFDKPAERARNNRSVNIAKLKVILEKMQGCQISKTTGYWKIDFDPALVNVDYQEYLYIINSKQEINKSRLQELTELIHRGSFLSNVEYDWLDVFKSEISNEIINTYLLYASTVKIEDDPEFLINVANYIFYFDPVNEDAMIINCKALVYLGKHSLAKAKFENFSKAYKAIYGEDFKLSFQDILE
ncbi:galactose oxidase [Pedobacter antarcticus]|uniref:galactose oxidase n=1 Tax=Pedobacter antarcticus TaxID=34086 RepID=UPI0029306BA2|nr:galactose oxidase [Pedobacter antarcticus]